MNLHRLFLSAACCALASALAVLAVSCGGGDDDDNAADLDNIPTATMPAELPTPLVVGDTIAQPPGGASTYVIRSGDTFASIADRFGVTLEALIDANPDIDSRNLTVGQVVQLPPAAEATTPEPEPTQSDDPTPADEPTEEPIATDTAAPEPTATVGPTNTPSSLGQTYIVKEGDIPVTIAAQFGITVEALLAANPGLDPTGLNIGDVLIIPPPPPEGG